MADDQIEADEADEIIKARAPRSDSRRLAFVPVVAAAFGLFLLMPRAEVPSAIPLPKTDMHALEVLRNDDHARAAQSQMVRLPSSILLVGTNLRALHRATTRGASEEDVNLARTALEQSVHAALSSLGSQVFEPLRALRAVQLELFLAEVETFERTGVKSDELGELGGGFLARMASAEWLDGTRVLLREQERRSAFKLVWNAEVGVEQMPPLALSRDEQRALYTLYIEHPHVPEAQRASFVFQRNAAASDHEACAHTRAQESLAKEQWRIEKLKRLGEIDPDYPTNYALGIAYYRAARYDASLESFRTWLERHPEGPFTLRAKNFMRAALAAYGPS